MLLLLLVPCSRSPTEVGLHGATDSRSGESLAGSLVRIEACSCHLSFLYLAQSAKHGGFFFGVLVLGDVALIESDLEFHETLLEWSIVIPLLFGGLDERVHDEPPSGERREQDVVDDQHYPVVPLSSFRRMLTKL